MKLRRATADRLTYEIIDGAIRAARALEPSTDTFQEAEIPSVQSPALRVLVVEDEALIRGALVLGLRQEGLDVAEAGDAASCRAAMKSSRFDAVVLDLGLPDADGVKLAAELCAGPRPGLIVVTRRAEMGARIEALDVGADDYLVKPVHYPELAARIRSVVRRRGHPGRRKVQLGAWLVDLEARTATADALSAGLTRGEFDILARLADAEGRVVSRDDLLEVISRNPQDSDPRSVDMLVSRLRRKLGQVASHDELIATAPGYGYRLNGASDAAG